VPEAPTYHDARDHRKEDDPRSGIDEGNWHDKNHDWQRDSNQKDCPPAH
jgi:hypothetical protein